MTASTEGNILVTTTPTIRDLPQRKGRKSSPPCVHPSIALWAGCQGCLIEPISRSRLDPPKDEPD
jgi:hypothetical protein